MDNSVYTFEQLLNQSLESQGEEDLCKTIQRCQERVLKKYDYDSSTVRKKFFREALLQIIIPYMLKELSLSCSSELPRFKELIFEDFSRFLLVNNMFEEVVLQSVTKDIMMAVKEAAVQRRHNLYRDSIILSSSDPNLHLLEEKPAVDWATKFGADGLEEPVGGGSVSRRKQVVSLIQLDGVTIPYESHIEVPGVELIPEEDSEDIQEEDEEVPVLPLGPKSPDSVGEIRGLINPVVEVVLPVTEEDESSLTNGTEVRTDTFTMDDGVQEKVTHITTVVEGVPRKSVRDKTSPRDMLRQLVGNKKQETDEQHQEEAAIKNAIEEIDAAVQEGVGEQSVDFSAAESESAQSSVAKDSSTRDDSGFQSPTNEALDEGEAKPITNTVNGEDKTIALLEDVQVDLV